MTRIFAPGPHRHIPDTAAVQQLEHLLAEAGELRDRIASACTGTAAAATNWPDRRRIARAAPTSRMHAPETAPEAFLNPLCRRDP
jgi:hypothetical protein